MAIQNAPPATPHMARLTPFAKAAFDETGRRLGGGKPDDITVVVAYVTTESRPTELVPDFGSRGKALNVLEEQKSVMGSLTKDAIRISCCKEAKSASGETRDVCSTESSYCKAKSSYLFRQRESFPPRTACLTTPAVRASVHSIPQSLRNQDFTAFGHFKQNALGRMENLSKGLVVPQNKGRENSNHQRESEEKANISKVLTRLLSGIL